MNEIDKYEQWKCEIKKLESRNIDGDLLYDYAKIGPKILDEVIELNKLNDKALKKYCKLHREKRKLEAKQLIKLLYD